jgi:hypothetical protein
MLSTLKMTPVAGGRLALANNIRDAIFVDTR